MSYEIQYIKDYLKKLYPQQLNLWHGVAVAVIDIDSIQIKSGEYGLITAYLPCDKKFAVIFKESKWITFDMEEQEFLKYFEVVQE